MTEAGTPVETSSRRGRSRPRTPVRSPASLPIRPQQTFALRRGVWQWSSVALGALALLALPHLMSTFWLHVTNLTLLAVVGAVALNLITGNARLVSLGHAAFLGVGGFTAGLLVQFYALPFPLVLVAAIVAGGLLGLIVGIPSLRLRVLYVAVTTLALHFGVITGLNVVQSVVLGSDGMVLPPPEIGPLVIDTPLSWYYLLLAVAALSVLIALNLLRSFVGRRWVAVAEHDIASAALGVRVIGAKLSVFVVTSAMTSFAGALAGYYLTTVSFETYSLDLAITCLAMVIVGGIASVLGSVLGAILITFLPYVLDRLLEVFGLGVSLTAMAGLHEVLYGGLIVAFLLFEPRGLAEVWRRLRTAGADWPFRYRAAQRGTR